MKHLTVDEIINFVSSGKIDQETLELMSKVNQHIRTCPKCLEQVRAIQLIHDEFIKLGTDKKFETYLRNAIKDKDISEVTVNADTRNEEECADFSM